MYEWLNSYQEWQQKIKLLEWKLSTYKHELERWCDPDDLGKYSLTKGSKAARLEDIIADLEHELADKMNELYDLKKVIYSFQGTEQHILRMKYIEGLTLKEIAIEFGYNQDYLRRKHRQILKRIEFQREKI
ncbi:sigma factor-like helix-turn-helix DNA-binding protein [Enterococcus olivae]